jgi:hypothetical protein
MGLPIGASGTPAAGASGSMGLPVGMSIGAPSGTFGGVGSTHPGFTSQNTISTRAQSSYNVQPEVTIAVRVSNAISQSARRKDVLLSVRRNITADTSRHIKGRTPPGVVLTTLSELNQELKEYGDVPNNYVANSAMKRMVGECASDPYKVAKNFSPLGIYHNRSPHNSSEPISIVKNSNVADILSVSISNHCHMRDIFGCRLHPGDKIGLVYMKYVVKDDLTAVEVVPHAGEWEPTLYEDVKMNNTLQWSVGNKHIETLLRGKGYQNNDNTWSAEKQKFDHVYIPLGRIWAPTMHAPFNQNQRENIVGPQSMYATDDVMGGGDPNKSLGVASQYKSLEVELSPFKRPFM